MRAPLTSYIILLVVSIAYNTYIFIHFADEIMFYAKMKIRLMVLPKP